MAKDWIEVADTAIKIGLGAMISGGFTYLGVKFTKQSEMRKYLIEHKTKLLEEISSDIEGYFSSWDSYIYQVSGIARRRAKLDKESEPLTQNQFELIKEKDRAIAKDWFLYDKALSKSRLISATDVADHLIEARALVKQFRDHIIFEHNFYTHAEVNVYKDKANTHKANVHNALAQFYDKIHS
ncbi:hypothetical protein [Vibrio campbellii]|uniref:hypothetical protein n=1 Tax=Vibrio campbellii TaxID=680 RepID=UPI0005EF7194|nr:hypothetical protein [Vibrio campbellii]